MTWQNQYFPQTRPHPGETLAEKLEEMRMGPKEFSLRTGKPEKTIIAVLKGKSAITPDMSVQFENVTKIPAHFWMNHQRSYDEFIAREKRKVTIEEAVVWAKKFPLSEMIKKNWLPPTDIHSGKNHGIADVLWFRQSHCLGKLLFKAAT